MTYGICNLSMVALRREPGHQSEMINQVLYGESFEILEQQKTWSFVKLLADLFEGWIDNHQFLPASADQCGMDQELLLSADLMEFVTDPQEQLIPIPIGSVLNTLPAINHRFLGRHTSGKKEKSNLLQTAYLYLNAPFLKGGRSPFGVDADGLSQMVYRLSGYDLPRVAQLQAQHGESLSFIEEAEAGDLAFFDNEEGEINHVGILMDDNHILHVSGKVRIDRLDHLGIYNPETRRHTHKLRLIKRIF